MVMGFLGILNDGEVAGGNCGQGGIEDCIYCLKPLSKHQLPVINKHLVSSKHERQD